MTRIRFNADRDGILRDRDGNELGRLTSLTIELTKRSVLGGYGGGFSSKERTEKDHPETSPGVGGAGEEPITDPVIVVWAYYVTVFDATRQGLNATRTTVIRNALKVRTVAECKKAIEGLRVSPYHNGTNDAGRKYLDIRYALAGISKNESADERIDKMGDLAPVTGGGIPSGDEGKIRNLLEAVRSTVQTGAERARGIAAKERLEQMGFTVLREGQRVWLER